LHFVDNLPTDAERQQLLGREADARDPAGVARSRRLTLEGLADADTDADADAGHLIDDEAVQAWADSLGTDHELPIPLPS
jgi:hypothetical protein